MSADDGPDGGSPQVGDALVAALGFEPTDGSGDGAGGSGPSGARNGTSSRRTAKAPIAEADAGLTLPAEAAEALLEHGNGSGLLGDQVQDQAGSTLDGAATERAEVADVAETGEMPSTRSLSDGRSSGVKPVAPVEPTLGSDEIPLEPPAEPVDVHLLPDGDLMPTAPPMAQVETGDHANGDYADEAASLLSGAGPATVPMAPPMADAGGPIGPPGGPGVVSPAAAGVATAGQVVRRGASGPESLVERMGGLASRMPQVLDDGLFQRTRRVRARKVRRVVRHIDPWSVLTFSVLFHLCVYAAMLLASVLVWNAAVAAGTIEQVESFIRDLGDYKTFEIQGDVVFRAAMVIAGILTLASSVLVVLLTVVFNLISDLVGGIRLTVIEEETVRVRRQRNQ